MTTADIHANNLASVASQTFARQMQNYPCLDAMPVKLAAWNTIEKKLFRFLSGFWGLCWCCTPTWHKTNASTKWIISTIVTMEPVLPAVTTFVSVCVCVCVWAFEVNLSINSIHSIGPGVEHTWWSLVWQGQKWCFVGVYGEVPFVHSGWPKFSGAPTVAVVIGRWNEKWQKEVGKKSSLD